MYYYYYHGGVKYTVFIVKVHPTNPDMVYVESAIGQVFMGWVNRSDLKTR